VSDFENQMKTEEMDEFELALQRALQRVDAPETLLKFLTAAAEVKRESVLPWKQRKNRFAFYVPRMQMWMGGALAAVLVAGAFTGARVHQEHVKQAQATQQFEQATQITDRALDHAREKMRKAGVDLDQ